MQFEAKIRALADKAKANSALLLTEEAAKTALVMPFLSALGYDVFDPREVVPEFVADVGVKKGEKVDYAIHHNGTLAMLVECKPNGVVLDQTHLSQLYRYYSVTSARFAILTNGVIYQFYTDLEQPNVLDKRPFLIFDLLEFQPSILQELKKFTRDAFNVDGILATASTLKYVSAIKAEIAKEFEAPSDEVVRLMTGRVYDGKRTAAIMAEFAEITKTALRDFVNDSIRQRLSTALDAPAGMVEALAAPAPAIDAAQPGGQPAAADEIETTSEETEGFLIVKTIVRPVIAPGRVFMRDQKSYCGIIVDDNNRKPLARLHFNRTKKYIGLFDGEAEERVAIAGLDDIFGLAERLVATAKKYA